MHFHRAVRGLNLLIVNAFLGQCHIAELIAVAIADGVVGAAVDGLRDCERDDAVTAETVLQIDRVSAGLADAQPVPVIHLIRLQLVAVGEVLNLRQYAQPAMVLPVALGLFDGVVLRESACLRQGEGLAPELVEGSGADGVVGEGDVVVLGNELVDTVTAEPRQVFVLVGAGLADGLSVPYKTRPLPELTCFLLEERLMHDHRVCLYLVAHSLRERGVGAVLLAAYSDALPLADVEGLLHGHLLDDVVDVHIVDFTQVAAHAVGITLVHAHAIDVCRELGIRVIEGVSAVVYFLGQVGVFCIARHGLEAGQSRPVEGHAACRRSGDNDVHIVVAYDRSLERGEGYLLDSLLLRRHPHH